MPNLLAYLRRKSLFTTLFLSILFLAALSVISSSTGWYLLENIRESQQRLSIKTLPLISASQSMATQSAAIAFIAPQIIRTENELRLDELYFELHRHLDFMRDIQSRIDGVDPDKVNNKTIRATISNISDGFELLRKNISTMFVLRQQTETAVDEAILKNGEIDELVNQEITELSDEAFHLANRIRQSGVGADNQYLDALVNLNQDNEILFGLNRKVIRIESLLRNLPKANLYLELREIKSRIDFEVRSMVGQSVGLSEQVNKKVLSAALAKLYQQLNLKENVEYLQRNLISQKLELIELDSRVKNDVFYLNSLIDGVVSKAEKNTLLNSAEANSAAVLGANILLAVAILSLVVSILVVWIFVIRKVILPLIEVSGMIRKLSNNQLDIEIKQFSMIELSEISQALEVFRSNSLALNEHKDGLLESNALLTRANEDLNAFVHVASHDIKTPLRGIRVLSDFIITDIKEGKLGDAQSNVHLLQQRIIRLGQLLDSLLNYTKLDSMSGVALRVDMMRVIHEAFSVLGNVDHFKLVLPQALPECDVVESDLVVIFMNLFDNAVSHHDLKEGVITVYFKETEDSYVFDVCDDGPGIALEFQEKVFSVFQKLEPKDEVEGAGVGLAYVKRVLESRGGQITLISNPVLERGCRFVFHYPKLSIEK